MTSGVSASQSQSLDVQLATHKAALTHCDAVLCCGMCGTRSKNTMLLIMVCERMVDMCAKILDAYYLHLDAGHSSSASPESRPSLLHVQSPTPTADSHTSSRSLSGASSSSKMSASSSRGPVSPLSVGSFHITSMKEWAAVMRIIIKLQLQTMGSLLVRMKALSTSEVQDVHHDMLRKLGDRVLSLLRGLGGDNTEQRMHFGDIEGTR